MPTSLIVVDDFLDNAMALREAAMRLTYPEQQSMFPGRNSQERINVEGLSAQVSRLVNEPLMPLGFPQSHGKFRISLASDERRANVHVDP